MNMFVCACVYMDAEVLVVGCLPQLLLFATLYFETESLWNLKFGDLAGQQALGIVVF